MKKSIQLLFGLALPALLTGCATSTPMDYTDFRAHRPRSILVPPPLNDSPEVGATYSYLSTVTRPLAEMGYYVYPVAVIDQFFKENGMPTAYEMQQIPLKKIDEIIGADAVLYTKIEQYGTKYAILNSATIVEVTASLVDVKTGTTIWKGHALAQQNSSDGNNGLAGMLVSAVVSQIINSSTDQAHNLCPAANAQLFTAKNRGLLYGPYRPEYLLEQQP